MFLGGSVRSPRMGRGVSLSISSTYKSKVKLTETQSAAKRKEQRFRRPKNHILRRGGGGGAYTHMKP
jgi:hypothetical protein